MKGIHQLMCGFKIMHICYIKKETVGKRDSFSSYDARLQTAKIDM